jgi:hypothetical protein
MFDPALLTLPLIHAHMLRARASLPSLRFFLPCVLDLTLLLAKVPSFMPLLSRTCSRVYSPYLVL